MIKARLEQNYTNSNSGSNKEGVEIAAETTFAHFRNIVNKILNCDLSQNK